MPAGASTLPPSCSLVLILPRLAVAGDWAAYYRPGAADPGRRTPVQSSSRRLARSCRYVAAGRHVDQTAGCSRRREVVDHGTSLQPLPAAQTHVGPGLTLAQLFLRRRLCPLPMCQLSLLLVAVSPASHRQSPFPRQTK